MLTTCEHRKKETWYEKIFSRKTISQTSRWLYRHPVTKMFVLKHEKYEAVSCDVRSTLIAQLCYKNQTSL